MRIAVYFAPPSNSLLHQLGSAWLGRDAVSGERPIQPDLDGIADLTAEPRRYGLHATLKPPFALKEGQGQPALAAAVADLAQRQTAFEVSLTLQLIDGFLALVPSEPSQALDDLAASCVRDLDQFRRPPDDAELARRRTASLSARQCENLLRWGYPYVFADFRFHLTLTRRLAPHEAGPVITAAAKHFAAVTRVPLLIDRVWMFIEPTPAAAFTAGPSFTFSSSLRETTP